MSGRNVNKLSAAKFCFNPSLQYIFGYVLLSEIEGFHVYLGLVH